VLSEFHFDQIPPLQLIIMIRVIVGKFIFQFPLANSSFATFWLRNILPGISRILLIGCWFSKLLKQPRDNKHYKHNQQDYQRRAHVGCASVSKIAHCLLNPRQYLFLPHHFE